jgi:hypothetical protein
MNLNPTVEHVCGGTLHFQGYLDDSDGKGPSFKCDKCGEEMLRFNLHMPKPGDRVTWHHFVEPDSHGVLVLVKIEAGQLFQFGILWDHRPGIIAPPAKDWDFWGNVQPE